MRRKVLSVMLLLAVVVLLSNLANAQHHGGDPYDPFNDCAVCHGEDLAGAMFGADWAPSCFDCHCQFLSAGNQPPVADPNGPYTGTVGQPVQFDGSGSTDPDGDSLNYLWDFGDGSPPPFPSQDPTATHTYGAAGIYTVSLTVTDGFNPPVTAQTTADIGNQVNQPPVADPNGPYTGTVGQPVQFDGTGSTDPDGTIISYDWNYGDGNIGTGPTPTHTYAVSGFYTVALTVTDGGDATDAATTTVDIGAIINEPPVVDPGGPYTGIVGQLVLFDASDTFDPEGDTLIYLWYFGDGSPPPFPTTEPVIAHTYSAPGIYTAQLAVTDGVNDPVLVEVSVEILGHTDQDSDGVPDSEDNCSITPNGPDLGTCTSGPKELIGVQLCTTPGINENECGTNGYCSMNQEDIYPPGGNGVGDACDCEGNFDCDGDVDGSDAVKFKEDFGRSTFKNPCPACQ